MGLKKVIKIFEKNSVQVCGMKGSGKDMLFANVVCRRKLPYISNVDYGGKFIPFDYKAIDLNGNTYRNFLEGDVKYYHYPYPDHADFYLSDCGIYFPAQYCNELNRLYPNIATFMPLTRHLGLAGFHTNAQVLNRVWDKIREQSETYINCRSCFVLWKLVIQRIRVYERYESCVSHVPPYPIKKPFFNRKLKMQWELGYASYLSSHGEIKPMTLIYWNRSKYDTRIFKTMLEGGKKE